MHIPHIGKKDIYKRIILKISLDGMYSEKFLLLTYNLNKGFPKTK